MQQKAKWDRTTREPQTNWFKRTSGLFVEAYQNFQQDRASLLAAALAYYTLFSLAPMLIILLALASVFVDQNHAQIQVIAQTQELMGEDAAALVAQLLRNPVATGNNQVAAVISIAALIYGATNVFAQLQSALNTVWGINRPPKAGFMFMLRLRAFSFVTLLLVGAFLILALIGIALLSLVDDWIQVRLPELYALINIAHTLAFFVIAALLFAMLYKALPDAAIRWIDTWVGAMVASILFNLGRWGIGLYIANSSTDDAFGAAGAVVVILVWIYFSAQFFLFGAEFARVYGRSQGHPIRPY